MTTTAQRKRALRKEIKDLGGYDIDGRTTIADLEAGLESLRKKITEKQALIQAKEEAEAKAKAERLARIESRGPAEEFAEKSNELKGEERKLAYIIRHALRVVSTKEEEIEKFNESMKSDPIYALSWGITQYVGFAKIRVMEELLRHFEYGCTFDDWKNYAIEQALRGARYPARSTSTTSNLMEQCITEAWGKHVEDDLKHGYY